MVNQKQKGGKQMNRMALWMRSFMSLCLFFVLSACATSQEQGVDRDTLRDDVTRIANRNNMNERAQNFTRMNDTDDNNLARGVRVSDEVAGEVAGLPEVKSAAAIVMGKTAYVAVVLDKKRGDGKVTDRLKEKITKHARAVDPTLRDVYVSANPDFVKQMNNYANDLRNGRPVSGLIKNLNDIIKRTFPEAK